MVTTITPRVGGVAQAVSTDTGEDYGFVRYSAPQTLTSAQKVQARDNIGVTDFVPFIQIDDYASYVSAGDWSAALDAAIVQAQTEQNVIVFQPGSEYQFDAGPSNAPAVLAEDKHVILDVTGATLVQNGDGPILEIRGNFTNVVTVSDITLTTVDMSSGTADPSPTHRITVSNASAYAAGNMAKIVSDDKLAGVLSTNNEREGEFFIIHSVDVGNNYIYTLSPLVFASVYSTNPRVALMNDSISGHIHGSGTFKSIAGFNVLWNQPLLRFRGLRGAHISDCLGTDAQAGFIETVSCVDFFASNIGSQRLRTASGGASGYALIDYSSEGTTYVNSYGHNCRNGYTTGVIATAEDDDVVYYGRSKYMVLSGNHFEAMQTTGISTHQDAYRGTFSNNICKQTYFGYGSANPLGFAIRGQAHTLDGNQTIGGTGYQIYCSTDNNDPSSAAAVRNIILRDNEHTYLGWETNEQPAVTLVGVQTPKKRGFIIDGLKIGGARTNAPAINFDWVEAAVSNLSVGGSYLDPGSATSFGQFIFDNSDVTFSDSVTLDMRGAANTSNIDIRTCVFDGDGSNVTCTSPIKHVVDPANNRWTRFMSTTGLTSATVINAQAESNAAPSSDWLSGSGTPDLGLKAFLDNGKDATFTPASVAYSTTGNKTVAHGFYGNDTIFRNFVVTASGVVINNVGAAVYIGQRTVWSNDATSTNSLTLDANGTNLDLGISDVVLAAGEKIVTIWNGTAHISEARAISAGSVTSAMLRDSAALSVIGRSANSSGVPADIAAAADYNILRRSGTSIGFGAIDLSQAGAVGTSILPLANGGGGVATTTGTFTISLALATAGDSSFSIATNSGRYTRFADLLFFDLNLAFTPTIGTGSGALQITGWPVNAAAGFAAPVLSASGMNANWAWPAGRSMVQGRFSAADTIVLNAMGTAVATADLGAAHMTTGASHTVRLWGYYKV